VFPSRVHPTILWALGLLDIDFALTILFIFMTISTRF
jgi:hypothetical protein